MPLRQVVTRPTTAQHTPRLEEFNLPELQDRPASATFTFSRAVQLAGRR